ncbi:Hypothetical predicted protein [Paramuricea clavata]|uniref:Uncharacterized protein n=1 Tax=Paramuricea clavata TaxID=317549 RepID=A0A6S7KH82_PARCT|nr:Hypothetical predicted protein [Paramuricea clavata]
MAKTLFLLVCLVIVLARTSKDERVDFQRGDKREDDAVGLPEFYLSLLPDGERLAYGNNPDYQYRRMSFEPRYYIGKNLLRFHLSYTSADFLLELAVTVDGKKQQLYVDTDLHLRVADKDGKNSEYEEVALHYNPNKRSVFVTICNPDFPFEPCVWRRMWRGDGTELQSFQRIVAIITLWRELHE